MGPRPRRARINVRRVKLILYTACGAVAALSGVIIGTALGVIFLALVRNGLNLMGVSPFLQIFTVGLLLFISAMADVIYSRMQK